MALVDVTWKVHAVHLYNQPEEMMRNWARISDNDPLGRLALSRPGETLNVATAAWGDRLTPEMHAHTDRYGMAHTLSTLFRDDITGLVSVIALYRADPARKYSEKERRLQQAVVAHLFQTWNMTQVLAAARGSTREREEAFAVVDRFGVLHSAEPLFVSVLRTEVPDWVGPVLPDYIVNPVTAVPSPGYIGGKR